MVGADGKRKGVLIVVDDFTRFTHLIVLDSLTSKEIADKFFDRVVSVYGTPLRVRTDAGREFMGDFRTLLTVLKVNHI